MHFAVVNAFNFVSSLIVFSSLSMKTELGFFFFCLLSRHNSSASKNLKISHLCIATELHSQAFLFHPFDERIIFKLPVVCLFSLKSFVAFIATCDVPYAS